MVVSISWATFDAAAPDSPSGGVTPSVTPSVNVSWAQFDTHATVIDVAVSWAQFDVAVPAQPVQKPKFPPVYAPGVLLSSYYDDVKKKYEIPIDVDAEEEDDIIAAILIELAYHVL